MYADLMPAPFLSVMTDDCIENGMDYNAGGARYNHTFIQFVGIGTLTDSLAALKKFVFDDAEILDLTNSCQLWTRLQASNLFFVSDWCIGCRSTATTTTMPTA